MFRKLMQAMCVAWLCISCTPATTQKVVEFLPTIVRYIQDAQLILDQIDSAAPAILALKGDEALNKSYEQKMALARQALQVAIRSSKGSQALSEDDTNTAFNEFREAYKDLKVFLEQSGLLDNGTMSASRGGTLQILDPLAVGAVQ